MNIRSKIFGGGDAPGAPLLRAKTPKGAKAEELRSVTVPREESRRSNDRAADRHRLSREIVSITHEAERFEAELINLSGGGAMVSAPCAPKLWDKVELHLGEHGTMECAVRWLRGDRIGLEFAHETRLDCPADQLAVLLRDTISRSFPEADLAAPQSAEAPPPPPTRGEDHRNAPRHPLIWSGVLHHDFQSTPVRVRNISETGAMIQTDAAVRVGAEPLLELSAAASISATVEWAIGDQVGLRFHHAFDMSLLSTSQPEVAPSRWIRPAYLEKAGTPESPWDPRWKRLSVGELKQELEGFLKH